MKKFFVLAVVLCLTIFVNQSNAEVEKKYDRITKQTTVQTKQTSIKTGKPQLVLLASYTGDKFPADSKSFGIAFVSRSKDWEYRNCNDTHILIDDEPYSPGEAKHNGTVGDGYVLEYLDYNVAFDSVQKMAVAKKIEVKICNTEFALSPSEMADLREFVRLLTPEK